MERVLVLFSLFFSFTAYGAVPTGVPNIGLGGSNAYGPYIQEQSSNPSGWFTLTAGGTVTANQFRAFVKDGGSQYQVGGSSITCYHMTYNGAGASARFQLASSTAADGITVGSLTAGQKYETGAATSFPHISTAAQTDYDKAIAYTFAASSYPYMTSDTTQVWGVILTCK